MQPAQLVLPVPQAQQEQPDPLVPLALPAQLVQLVLPVLLALPVPQAQPEQPDLPVPLALPEQLHPQLLWLIFLLQQHW